MRQTFLEACPVDGLRPGAMRRIELAGRSILLANVEGRFFAVDDTCTHEDASLAAGSLKGELVKCPLHNSCFSVRTGKVLEEPAEQDLRIYPVRVEGGRVLIGVPAADAP